MYEKLSKKPSYRRLQRGKFFLEHTKGSCHDPIIFEKSDRAKALEKIQSFHKEKVAIHGLHRNGKGQVVACIAKKSTVPLRYRCPDNQADWRYEVVLVCPYGLMPYTSLNEENNVDGWAATLNEAKKAFDRVKNMTFVMYNYVGDRGHRLLIPFYPAA